MGLKETLQDHMKTAMKAQEPLKVSTLRMLISEIKKREIDKRSPLDDGEIQKTIATLIKQRNDSIDAFTKGNRPELADKEKSEIAILQAYLPQQMSPSEIEAIVKAAITETQATKAADLGKVMKAVLAKTGGRADGKVVNELVRKNLPS